MKKLILGSVLAAVAVYVFGAVFWMGPLASLAVTPVPDEDAAQRAIASAFPASGSYALPRDMEAPDQAAWEARHVQGPLAIVHVRAEGGPPMEPATLLRGFLLCLATAFVLAFLLRLVAPAVPSYRSRLLLVGLLGVLVAVYSDVGAHFWWMHSTAFAGTVAVYDLLGFLIMGAVLAAFVKPGA